jgi:hypothetical protein
MRMASGGGSVAGLGAPAPLVKLDDLSASASASMRKPVSDQSTIHESFRRVSQSIQSYSYPLT